jgi:hypothetical protein
MSASTTRFKRGAGHRRDAFEDRDTSDVAVRFSFMKKIHEENARVLIEPTARHATYSLVMDDSPELDAVFREVAQ